MINRTSAPNSPSMSSSVSGVSSTTSCRSEATIVVVSGQRSRHDVGDRERVLDELLAGDAELVSVRLGGVLVRLLYLPDVRFG